MSFLTSLMGGKPKTRGVDVSGQVKSDKVEAQRLTDAKRLRIQMNNKGVAGTMLTTPLGLQDAPSTLKPTLGAVS